MKKETARPRLGTQPALSRNGHAPIDQERAWDDGDDGSGQVARFRELEAQAQAMYGAETNGATPEEAAAFWRECADQGVASLEEVVGEVTAK